MNPVVLEADHVRAEIIPSLGGGLGAFDVRGPNGSWLALMRCAPPGVRWFNDLACYFLAPWPNRIAGGRFTWRGREVSLTPDWPDGTAIHGLVKDKPWRPVERTPISVALEFESADSAATGWPWPFRCGARYELLDDGLSIGLSLRNTGDEPMPAGLGFHPFFVRRLGSMENDVSLRYAPRGRYPARGMIPTGPAAADDFVAQLRSRPVPLDGRFLDDVFDGSTDGASLEWAAGGMRARFACAGALGHGVVYTGEPQGPPRDFVCFEPVSMVNDGFNLHSRGMQGTGVVELAPGQDLTAAWAIRIGTI